MKLAFNLLISQSLCLVAFWALTILKQSITVDADDSAWHFRVSQYSWIGTLFSWLMCITSGVLVLISIVMNTITKNSLRNKVYFISPHFIVHHQGKPRWEIKAETWKSVSYWHAPKLAINCLLYISPFPPSKPYPVPFFALFQVTFCAPPPPLIVIAWGCVNTVLLSTYMFRAIWPRTAFLS